MSIDPEVTKMVGEVAKIANSEAGKGFIEVISDFTGIRPRAIIKRAEAEAKKVLLISKAESDAALNKAEAERRTEIIKAKGEIEIAELKTKGKIKEKTLRERTLARTNRLAQIEQKNIEQIAGKALFQLTQEKIEEKPDEDWVYRFFDNCKGVSNNQMQTVWSKILAMEVSKPGSFSKLTLEAMKAIGHREAELFTKLGSQAWSLRDENVVVYAASFATTNNCAAASTLFNLYDHDMQILMSYGLVNRWDRDTPVAGYQYCNRIDDKGNEAKPLVMKGNLIYFGKKIELDPDIAECEKVIVKPYTRTWCVRIDFKTVTLSSVGKELMPIAGSNYDEEVVEKFRKMLESCTWIKVFVR